MQSRKGMMSPMRLISRAQPRRPSAAKSIQEPRPLALETVSNVAKYGANRRSGGSSGPWTLVVKVKV